MISDEVPPASASIAEADQLLQHDLHESHRDGWQFYDPHASELVSNILESQRSNNVRRLKGGAVQSGKVCRKPVAVL